MAAGAAEAGYTTALRAWPVGATRPETVQQVSAYSNSSSNRETYGR